MNTPTPCLTYSAIKRLLVDIGLMALASGDTHTVDTITAILSEGWWRDV